jgi:hypothetical protein
LDLWLLWIISEEPAPADFLILLVVAAAKDPMGGRPADPEAAGEYVQEFY